jgi:hypothetical protein
MLTKTGAVLSLLWVTGCLGRDYTGPLPAEIRSNPSVLVMDAGETKTVTVEAFVGNDPHSVSWNIGTVGPGLVVVVDTTYGRSYVNGVLVLPSQSPSRRFEVTMNGVQETSFVISGGTGTATIPVHPPAP